MKYVFVIIVLFTASCGSVKEDNSNGNTASQKPAFIDQAEQRSDIHQVFSRVGKDDFNAALDRFIQDKYPGSSVKGISEEARGSNIYLIAVDVFHPTKRQTVYVIGQIFKSTSDDHPYWKIEVPTNDLLSLLGIGDSDKTKLYTKDEQQ